jgi:hypothetical protein
MNVLSPFLTVFQYNLFFQYFIHCIAYLIILLLENYVKFLENFMMLSLNKWNQREVYSEITYYEFCLLYGII